LRQAEKCFTLAATPLDQRVHLAEVFLTGRVDHWLRSIGVNTDSLSWSDFASMINNRFVAETGLELIDSFKHIEQPSSVSCYIDAFEDLMGKIRMRNPTLIEDYFVGCFVSGLREHIKDHAPSTLVEGYELARNFEHTTQRRTTTDSYKWNTKSSSVTKSLPLEKTEKLDDKSKMISRWEKGKCFKCQEPWVLGHNRTCKFRNQIHSISIKDEDTSEEETPEPTPPD
jgi:hypothetical protein